MTIRPIDLNGMIQRADDVSILKRQEDTKSMHDQQNIQMQVNKREDQLAHRVINPEEAKMANNDSDAKEEGRNKYFSTSKQNKKKAKTGDRVVNKATAGHFDIKI